MTPNLDLAGLHSLTRESVSDSSCGESAARFRERLQQKSCEREFQCLLASQLKREGLRFTMEARIPHLPRKQADFLLEDAGLYIELKQLHLKDPKAKYVSNVVKDLTRHRDPCLGVVYLLDERESESEPCSFGGANRRAKCGVDTVLTALSKCFGRVHPSTQPEALIRTFHGNGRLDLYAFVVSEPVRSAANASR